MDTNNSAHSATQEEDEFLMVEPMLDSGDSESETDAGSHGEHGASAAALTDGAALAEAMLAEAAEAEDEGDAYEEEAAAQHDEAQDDAEEQDEAQDDAEEQDEAQSPASEDRERDTISMPRTADFWSDAGAEFDVAKALMDADQLERATRALQTLCAAGSAHLSTSKRAEAVRAALAQPHVVQALQAFAGSAAVREAVVDVARSEQAAGQAVLRHTGNLLVTLGDLVNRAPELAQLAPALMSALLQGELPVAAAAGGEGPTAEAGTATEAAAQADTQTQTQTQGSASAPVVHVHVLCDGCSAEESRAQASAAAGHRAGAYIAGVRWKSAIIEDFDLCSACEASGALEDSHGPFLKITAPKKAPRQLIVVLRGEEPADEAAPPSPRGGCRGRGMRCRGGRRPQAPSAAQQQQEQQQDGDAPEAQASQAEELRCPLGGHKLEGFCASIGFACDVCRCAPGFGQPMFGCRRCNWDMCVDCAASQRAARAASSAAPSQTGAPQTEKKAPAAAQAARPAEAEPVVRPQARFVSDVSLPDGAVVLPGTPLTKTWRIENPAATAPWPSGVRLVCVGGERMGGPLAGLPLPRVPAQEHLDLNLPLTAPETPGRYVGYWRLVTADNQRFGHRLWIDLTVAAPERFGEQLRALADMGFSADASLVRLLEEEDGDLARVVPRLCN